MELVALGTPIPDDDYKIYLVSQKLTRNARGLGVLPVTVNVAIGNSNEMAIKHILEAFTKSDLYKDPAMYAKCDFYNSDDKATATVGVEVKGRVDIPHNDWPTGFVDVHKVEAHKPHIKYYYVFIYNNGIYYTPYNRKRFNSYNIDRSQTEYRPDLGRKEISPKYEVPYTDMRLMCSFNDE